VAKLRGLISACIAFHLVALAVESLPDPDELRRVEPHRANTTNRLSAALTPTLDRIAAGIRAVEPTLANVVAPLRFVTRPYVAVSLTQRWDMFSNPMTIDQYVRVDQYVMSSGRRSARVFQELVLPAQREDQPQFVHKFRDKAMLIARDAFVSNRRRDPRAAVPPDDLRPVARYFRNQFLRNYASPDERVLRTEVWLGESPIPPLGERVSEHEFAARLDVLQRYWDGPSERPPITGTPAIGAVQREADIEWKLEYAERP
jgi:hypothetical protein